MSLKDNALIVSISVGKPQMTKTDSKATQDAEQANNAHNAGKYTKDLFPKHLIAPIKALETSARYYVECTTYPWRRGEYLLPTTRFMDFADRMAKFELEFNQLVTGFMQNFVNVLDEARRQQGDLFDENDYPDVSDIRNRFTFGVNYLPVPEYGDFRVDLQEEEKQLLKEQVEAQHNEAMEEMMRKPLERLREVVAKLNEVCKKDDRVTINKRTGEPESKPPIFRDSVVDNIKREIDLLYDFAEVMPSDIQQLNSDVANVLREPELLRNDEGARKDVAQNTDALLEQINNMLEM